MSDGAQGPAARRPDKTKLAFLEVVPATLSPPPRRASGPGAFTDHATRPFIREKFTKERTAARKLAAEYFERYPKERYQTEIESWRHPQSQNIELSR
jgi:hypothetical protein